MPEINSQPVSVVVYPDRARITRRGMLALEPGLHRLTINELPARLDEQSVRATAYGTAQARLLGVASQRAYTAETRQEEIRELERQLESLQDEQRLVEARLDSLRASRQSLVGLASQVQIYATALAAGEMKLEEGLALLDGLRSRMQSMDAEIVTAETQKRDLERRAQKLKKDLDRWHGTARRESATASVEVEVTRAGELTVELSYVLPGAGWQPLYDIRFHEGDVAGEKAWLEVGYLAQVMQRSGEAWQEVRLTLSTARPALASALPELDPWFIQPILPPPPLPRAAGPAMMKAMAVSDAGEVPESAPMMVEMAAADVMEAQVGERGAAVTYELPAPVTIPGDGAPHKVTVTRLRLDPKLDYASAPRVVEAVYRRARAENASPYTLLPGPANLFSGEDFIGTTQLDLIAPEAELEIYLGVDDRVRVERELERRDVDKRLIGSKRQIHYAYTITVENLLAKAAPLRVQDSLPVARHEDIQVRLDSAEPRPAQHSELNILTWELSLAPGEKRVVRYAFTVEHPREMNVAGLP